MKRKVLLILILVLALAAAFTACEPTQPQEQHEHSFADKLTYDENYHWYAAVCEHTDEVSGKASHDMAVVPTDKSYMECRVCGYGYSVDHEHTYAKEYSANENGHWLSTACGCNVLNFALHGYVDGICSTCGWWRSASDVLFAELSKSDIWNYAVLFDKVHVSNINLPVEELKNVDITLSGELKLGLTKDGQIEGCGNFEADGVSLKAVVSEGKVYACGNDSYFRCDLNELLEQNGIDVNAYVQELDANTRQIREYVEELKQSIASLPIDGVITDELLRSLVKLDENKSTEDVSVYYFDTAILRSVNQMLGTATMADYVNAVLGKLQGTPLGVLFGDDFYALPDKVYSLLKKTILQTRAELKLENFDLDDLFDQLDALIAKYYPDDSVNNIDELLAAMGIDLSEIAKPLGISLKGVKIRQLVEAVSMASPETLWNMMQQDEADKISAEDISNKLTQYVELYGDKTVYDIAAAEKAELTADYIKALADGVADLLDETVSLEFYVDKEGVLKQVSLSVGSSDTVYEQVEIEQIKQLLANIGGTIVLKRDYNLQQDYSQVIAQVNAYYDSL